MDGESSPPDRLGSAYWRTWIASSISVLGDGVRFTAMPLLAASITRNPIAVSLVTVAGFAPWLLLSLIAGALVDRWDRRHVMWSADLFRTIVMGGFAVLVAFDHASIPLIVVASFLLGVAETMFDNASQSILPSLVRRDQLARANGRLYAGQIIGQQFAGPPLGGLLFSLLVWCPFGVDAASFAIASLLVLTLRGRFREPRDADAPKTRLSAEIGEGVRWLWGHRVLRAFCSMLGIWNLVSTATMSIEVLWALHVLHLGPRGYGLLGLGMAAGSLFGSLLSERVIKRLGEASAIYISLGLGVITTLIAYLTRNAFVAGSTFVIFGFSTMIWNVITVSLRQEIIPPRLLGRVNSAYRFVGWGSMPIGALVGGFIADAFGLRAPFLFATVVVAVCAVLMSRAVTSRSIAAAREAATS